MPRPTITLLDKQDAKLRAGSPWIFANQVKMRAGDEPARSIEPGSVVTVQNAKRQKLGLAHFNPNALIVGRLLTRNADASIDAAFVRRKLARARAIREALFQRPHWRWAHGEADGLPGLVIDRFGDVVVAQINTAGWAAMEEVVIEAIAAEMEARAIVVRTDAPAAGLEGIEPARVLRRGALDGPIAVLEEALEGRADPIFGQKTGWYFDQRANRAFVARLAGGRDALDLYCGAGGFALACASVARSILAIDRSEDALALARAAPAASAIGFEQGEAFEALDALSNERRRFGVVIADPPPFVRAKKDRPAGMRAYRKLARMTAALVEPGGFLAIASCSHNAPAEAFASEVAAGLREAGRAGTILRSAGAGPDHPALPALPETAYLKFLTLALD